MFGFAFSKGFGGVISLFKKQEEQTDELTEAKEHLQQQIESNTESLKDQGKAIDAAQSSKNRREYFKRRWYSSKQKNLKKKRKKKTTIMK